MSTIPDSSPHIRTNTNTKNTNTNTGRDVNTIEHQTRPLYSHPAGSFTKQTLAGTLTVDIGQMLEKYRLYTQEYFQKRTREESKYRKSDDQQTDLLTLVTVF